MPDNRRHPRTRVDAAVFDRVVGPGCQIPRGVARGSVEEFYVAMTERLRAAIEFRIILAPDPLGVPPKPRIRQHHGASRHLRTAVAIDRMASAKSALSLSRKHEIAPRYSRAAIGSPVQQLLSARACSPLDDPENAPLLNPATAELFHHQTGGGCASFGFAWCRTW